VDARFREHDSQSAFLITVFASAIALPELAREQMLRSWDGY
jgi:hypothetical protein